VQYTCGRFLFSDLLAAGGACQPFLFSRRVVVQGKIAHHRESIVMVMPYQQLHDAAFGRVPMIVPRNPANPLRLGQLQSASIDLRIDGTVTALFAAALPNHNETVAEVIAGGLHRYDFELEVGKSFKLDRGMTYIVELAEECRFPDHVRAQFSPKSSTGRNDVFVRVLCDGYSHYDHTPLGYRGPLYLEITPLSFNVSVCRGESLVQGRLKTPESHPLSGAEITKLHTKYGIVFDRFGEPLSHEELRIVNNSVYFHVDLDREVVGFVSSDTTAQYLELGRLEAYEARHFWQPILRPESGRLIMMPGKFYLLATKERVRIPAECCAEIASYEITTGEFRSHYAGFFDNGFGGEQGTNCVLEVRVHDVPFRMTDGQSICAMHFEHTFEVPEKLYEGNYTGVGPSLSKHFKNRYKAWEGAFWR